MEVENNPWNVLSLEAYHFYFCPECETKHETKDQFVGHAIVKHPRAREFIPSIVDIDTVPTEPVDDELEADIESIVSNDNLQSDSEYHNEEVEFDREIDLENNDKAEVGPLMGTEVNEEGHEPIEQDKINQTDQFVKGNEGHEPMTDQDKINQTDQFVEGNGSIIKTEYIDPDYGEVDINTIISNEKIEPMTVEFKEEISEAKIDIKSKKSVKKTSMINIKSDADLNRKAYCFICKDMRTKIARHFQAVHKEHYEIKPLLSLDKADRNKGLELIKNKTTHEHNCQVLDLGFGDFIVSRKPDGLTKPSDYIFCPFCFKYVLKNNLSGHEKNCEFRPTKELLGKSELKKKSAEILKERKLKLFQKYENNAVIMPHIRTLKIPKINPLHRVVNKDIKEYFIEFINNLVIPRQYQVNPFLEIMQKKYPVCKYTWIDVKKVVHYHIKRLKKSKAKNSN